MATKSKPKPANKKGTKGQVKTLNLKRETIKDVSSREQKKIKGGGGAGGGVVQSRVVGEK
jgi:hypothetical protein